MQIQFPDQTRFVLAYNFDDVRDRGRVPCCDSLGVRRKAKAAGEAMLWELDHFA
jgi:hypothetical protein